VELDWSPNCNHHDNQFVIETNVGYTGNWTLLNFQTKTSFIHTGFLAGIPMKYIVKARRSAETSGPSNIAYIIMPG
jgi:hypothetical protein